MTSVEEQLDKRFYRIILNCQNARNRYPNTYEKKYKKQRNEYSKEIIENNLIEKCGEESYFARQLCMANGLEYK
jgi:hypothetical protein